MKHFFLIGICLAFFLCGCASSPTRISLDFKTDLNDMLTFRQNMTPEEVIGLMGTPARPVLIYFYMTEGEGSFFSRFSKDNYTPFVFVDNKLAGWGWNYLNVTAKDIMNN